MEDRNGLIGRRGLLAGGAALSAASLLYSTQPDWAASEAPVKIGMIDPRTSNFAALGVSEIKGAEMAAAEINAKGGIMGRPLQLIVEDSAGSPATATDKASRLLSRDKVNFLMGSVNSAVSLSLSQFAERHGVLFLDTGGHADAVTGTECKWTTFRTCGTTWMLTSGDFETLVKKFGKRWYFLTTDYAFGHAEQTDYAKQLAGIGGKVLGNALAPIGTGDFSSYLIQIKAAKPDVLCLLLAGDDQVNAMKQITQFGINKEIHVGGALLELEQVAALPPAARYGWWTFEWYWQQAGNAHVADFVARYKKRYSGQYPSARSWFGFASTHAIRLAVEKAKSVQTLKVVRAMEGMELPPEVALQPGAPAYRAADHQLQLSMFPGEVKATGKYPDLFTVADIVPASKAGLSAAAVGCKMKYPS
ncbi:MAG: ABC transporter substrate-binding protein [Acetobacteraceae bacterium]